MLTLARRLLLFALPLAATAIAAPTASASFAGADGNFALQPLSGDGVLVAGPRGQDPHRICSAVCGSVVSPHWSPDGRELSLGGVHGSRIIYGDGTCEDCIDAVTSGPPPVFTATPTLLTAPSAGPDSDGVTDVFADGRSWVSLDGEGQPFPIFQSDTASAASAVDWSSTGKLAYSTHGQITAGPVGRLRPLGAGSQPSWSPEGRQLAVRRSGWITIVNVRTGASRRIGRGSSPVWAPAGGSLAYLGAGHVVTVRTLSSGRTRTLTALKGRTLDWAPKVVGTPACTPIQGSAPVLDTGTLIITGDVPTASAAFPQGILQGCLRSVGEERTLGPAGGYGPASTATAVDGDDVALATVQRDYLGGGVSTTRASATIADLRTGEARTGLASEACGKPAPPAALANRSVDPNTCVQSIDNLVLDDGMLAMHVISNPAAVSRTRRSARAAVTRSRRSSRVTPRDRSAGRDPRWSHRPRHRGASSIPVSDLRLRPGDQRRSFDLERQRRCAQRSADCPEAMTMHHFARRLLLLAVPTVAAAVLAPAASASFSGHDGDLALQPLSGDGVLVVGPRGQEPHRLCAATCGKVASPRWSPDGRQLVLGGTDGSRIIYSDGTCGECLHPLSSGPVPVFTPTAGLLTAPAAGTDRAGVTELLADGRVAQPLTPQGHPVPLGASVPARDRAHASEVAWSSTSELAFVTHGQITAGTVGHLRGLGAGTEPSWSRNGQALAVDRDGWITVITVRSGASERIARGSSPAWAPGGGALA